MMATFPISDFQDINYDLGKRSPFLLIDFRDRRYPAPTGGGQTPNVGETKTQPKGMAMAPELDSIRDGARNQE
jgi:hypothetical protein